MNAHATAAEFRAAVPLVAIICGASLFGTTAYFGRVLPDLGFAGAAVAFFRFALTALVLTPFLVVRGPGRIATLWGLAGGAGIALGWIGYVKSLETLPVAEAAVLFMTYPLFALVFAAAFFGERAGRRGLLAAGLIVIAAVVGTPVRGFDPSEAGAILAGLATPAAYGLLLNIIAHRLGDLPSLSAAGSVALGAVLGTTPLVVQLEPAAVIPSDLGSLGLLLVMSLASALVPELLYVRFAPRLGAVRTAIAGSAELPSMFAVGWLVFGEVLTPAHAAAAVLIMTAIAVTPMAPPPVRIHARLPDETT